MGLILENRVGRQNRGLASSIEGNIFAGQFAWQNHRHTDKDYAITLYDENTANPSYGPSLLPIYTNDFRGIGGLVLEFSPFTVTKDSSYETDWDINLYISYSRNSQGNSHYLIEGDEFGSRQGAPEQGSTLTYPGFPRTNFNEYSFLYPHFDVNEIRIWMSGQGPFIAISATGYVNVWMKPKELNK